MRIICTDALQGIDSITEPVDLFLTSPPYNAGFDYGPVDDARPWSEYYLWMGRCLRAAYEKAATGARLALVVAHQVSNSGRRSPNPHKEPLAAGVTRVAVESGWEFREWIPWRKSHVGGSPSTAWGQHLSINPQFCSGMGEEAILVFHKETRIKPARSLGEVTKQQWIDWLRNPWYIKASSEFRHPAPFPLELPSRLILLYTLKGDLVCDPFVGSGTTAQACSELGRGFIGFDLNPAYCELARMKVAQQRLLYA